MCPVCLATLTAIVAGATSAGGLTALAMKRSRGETPENFKPWGIHVERAGPSCH